MNPVVLYIIFLALVLGIRVAIEASERRAWRRHYSKRQS